MHITDSYFINSNASFNDTFGTETSDNWYLEANFKCKLYSGDPFDPNYTKNALYITDGVIKGCFLRLIYRIIQVQNFLCTCITVIPPLLLHYCIV